MNELPGISKLFRAAPLILAANLVACGSMQLGSRPDERVAPPPADRARTGTVAPVLDAVAFLREAGLLAHGYPLAFAGSVGFLASSSPDSAHAVVSLALAPSALTFRRETDQYRADYRVTITVRRGDATISRVETAEVVRVASIRETARADDAIVFQEMLTVPAGAYALTVTVRDEGTGRLGSADLSVRAPAFSTATISSPIAYLDVQVRRVRDSLPRIVANPKASATYGRDSVLHLYVEGYGESRNPDVAVALRSEGVTVWSGTATLAPIDGGVPSASVRIPVDAIAPGAMTVVVRRPGAGDSATSPVLIGVGEEIPPTTFADILSHLRYFAPEGKLTALGATSPAQRGAAWAAFYRETDPDVRTREHEGIEQYLSRIRHANANFPEGATPGWRTDRGMVWLLLGPYDRVVDQLGVDADRRGRTLLWEYRGLNLTVEFTRTGALDRWRLTESSEAEVRAATRRLQDRVGAY